MYGLSTFYAKCEISGSAVKNINRKSACGASDFFRAISMEHPSRCWNFYKNKHPFMDGIQWSLFSVA